MTTITSENVKFNGTLDNAAVLSIDSGIKTLILTDDLSISDRAMLDAFIADNGGANPLAGPTAGHQQVVFKNPKVGTDVTGLSGVAAATSGTATVDVGGAAVGTTETGLKWSFAEAGRQVVVATNNAHGAVYPTDYTGLYGTVNTGGTQSVTWTGLAGANPTGLLNDSTVYTQTFVFGRADQTTPAAVIPVSVIGSSAQTFTSLLTQMNAALTGYATITIASPTELLITGTATGFMQYVDASTAFQTDNLFAMLTGSGSIQGPVYGSAIVADTTYTADVIVDGVSIPVSVSGSQATTFEDLVAAINTDLGAAATATFDLGILAITSSTVGSHSTVSIQDTNLFSALIWGATMYPATRGSSSPSPYSASILIDGIKLKPVVITLTPSVGLEPPTPTYTKLIAAMNAALGSDATAALVGGNLVITSSSTGANSSVSIYDCGLFSALTGYAGITTSRAVEPTIYTATVNVDGVDKLVVVQGSVAQTYTTLLAEINTDLGGAATATLTVNGQLAITSATTGSSSSVTIVNDNLFNKLNEFAYVTEPTKGVTSLVDALKAKRIGGATAFDLFNVKYVGAKPPVPAVPAVLPKTTDFVYWNGTVWKYLADDTNV